MKEKQYGNRVEWPTEQLGLLVLTILFVITAAGTVPGSPKMSTCSSSIVQIIFVCRYFVTSENIQSF